MTPRKPIASACPCDSGYPLEACCAPYIAGLAPAPTALALMRSRYTAHALGKADYLLATWHPRTRPPSLEPEPGRRWLGLRIVDSVAGNIGDSRGAVEFVARFKVRGRGHRVHEASRFELEDGRWFYVDGEIRPPRR